MTCSLGISDFLEEISSLSHSIVFLYFFALVTEEGFLISPCYSLELCIQNGISFLFSFAFHFPLFTAFCKASSDRHFAFLHFCFLGRSWFLSPVQCHEPPSIVHQALCLSDLVPFSLVQFSHPVVSNSLRPHESQHARPPCPSPSPRGHSDSHSSSQ